MAKYNDIVPRVVGGQHLGYSKVTDLTAIRNSLMNLFTIRKGEVPGKPWLGSPIHPYIFDNIGFFEERSIETALRNTLEKYEPRVRLIGLKTDMQEEYNLLKVSIDYIIYIDGNEVFDVLNFTLVNNTMTTIETRTT